jgi:hypothetical protein
MGEPILPSEVSVSYFDGGFLSGILSEHQKFQSVAGK